MTQAASAEVKLTPMMMQYKSIKNTLPSDTILFFRLGDFYEMFFEDAIKASEILNITLTGREGGEAGRVPMCGIPYHAFQGYVRKLIDKNLKVAICEQIGDPQAAKGIVERKITRIISPATYLEDDLKGKNSEYLTALVFDQQAVAIACLELSTGDFFVRQVEAQKIEGELSMLDPREMILSQSVSRRENLVSFIKTSLNVSLTVYEDWVFEASEGERLLLEVFKLASIRNVGFYQRSHCISAVGAILYYLRDHLHKSLEHIQLPSLMDSSDYMVLDRQTQRSLELVSSMSSQGSGLTLLSAIDQTLTMMGARTLYQWITQPLLSRSEILRRQDSVSFWVKDAANLIAIRALFKGIRDMERTLSRLNCGVANARDLINLKLFLERIPEIQSVLRQNKSDLIDQLCQDLIPFPELKNLISAAIVEEPPLSLKDGGIIRDGFSKDLDELRDISKNGKSWILDFERREIERTGIKSLKIKYSQVFGYTIEVSKSNLSSVPSDYIRRQTLANAERFIVPELQGWDEKITGAEDKIKAFEYQLFSDIRTQILQELSRLQKMAKSVGTIDALASLALSAVQKKWVCPDVVDSDELEIISGRHPVVETMLPAGKFVENDTVMNRKQNQLIVLTGPNMAGKSTFIRQVAHIVLLAQIGSFVPASRAKIGIVDRIFTRIGAADDLARGESTFMVEMLETAHILNSATDRSLLILDEVGRGTSTFDGVSIAWAICEYLAKGKVRPRTLFATHYHELTQLEEHFPTIKNFNITVKETADGIIFLRKVVPGGSDRSYGIHVAKLAGIPQEITGRAREILEILESEHSEATEIIEHLISKDKKVRSSKQDLGQLSLFAEQGLSSEKKKVLDELSDAVVDDLTPVQALNKIVDWKKLLNGGKD